jgi:sphingosine kinase
MAYMTQDSNIFQAACINDGFMDLVSIDGTLPFTTSLGMFMSVENGNFFDHPHVSYRKIVAYRIIPRNQDDGYISVDGERIPFAPFQAEIHKGLCKVLSKRGVYEAPGPTNWDKVTIADRIHA